MSEEKKIFTCKVCKHICGTFMIIDKDFDNGLSYYACPKCGVMITENRINVWITEKKKEGKNNG